MRNRNEPLTLSRRRLLQGGAALLLGGQAACTPPIAPTPQTFKAEVDLLNLAQVATDQNCEQWCWAASTSMMFSFYNHPLSQESIVLSTYGRLVCLPAQSPIIVKDLSRSYRDENGRVFTSQITSAYSSDFRVNTFTNESFLTALQSNRPLLYVNTHHAMVVYSATYIQTAQGPSLLSVAVVDPWPTEPRVHNLTDAEMVPRELGGEMTFLADIRIS